MELVGVRAGDTATAQHHAVVAVALEHAHVVVDQDGFGAVESLDGAEFVVQHGQIRGHRRVAVDDVGVECFGLLLDALLAGRLAGGGHRRHGAHRREVVGHLIRAVVAAGDWNCPREFLVDDTDGGVVPFVVEQVSGLAHRDAARHQADEAVVLAPMLVEHRPVVLDDVDVLVPVADAVDDIRCRVHLSLEGDNRDVVRDFAVRVGCFATVRTGIAVAVCAHEFAPAGTTARRDPPAGSRVAVVFATRGRRALAHPCGATKLCEG